MAKLKAEAEEELRKFIEKKHPSEAALAKKKKELHGQTGRRRFHRNFRVRTTHQLHRNRRPTPAYSGAAMRAAGTPSRASGRIWRTFFPAFRRPVSDAEVNRLVRLVPARSRMV